MQKIIKKKKNLYDNYVLNLSNKISNRLNEISADYNFDYGDEFEFAICDLLRAFLPNKFGICRGFVVNKEGEKAGDDIIIYDQERFPTLKMNYSQWTRKENIPIESVYAYIEAKHTIDISNTEGSTLFKALDQINNVKNIVNTREKYELNQYDPYHLVKNKIVVPPDTPPYRNPIFGMIISRHAIDLNSKQNDNHTIRNGIQNFINSYKLTNNSPEGIIVGQNSYIYVSSFINDAFHASRFIIPDKENIYSDLEKESHSFAIAFIHLFSAIDWIRLHRMPWEDVFNDIKNN